MVKSIINVRRSSICWRGRRELIRRQKTRNHGYDAIVGQAVTDYSDHPQTCHAKPRNSKSTGAGRHQLLSRWWDTHHRKQQPERLLSKSQDAVALQQIKGVALYL